ICPAGAVCAVEMSGAFIGAVVPPGRCAAAAIGVSADPCTGDGDTPTRTAVSGGPPECIDAGSDCAFGDCCNAFAMRAITGPDFGDANGWIASAKSRAV